MVSKGAGVGKLANWLCEVGEAVVVVRSKAAGLEVCVPMGAMRVEMVHSLVLQAVVLLFRQLNVRAEGRCDTAARVTKGSKTEGEAVVETFSGLRAR